MVCAVNIGQTNVQTVENHLGCPKKTENEVDVNKNACVWVEVVRKHRYPQQHVPQVTKRHCHTHQNSGTVSTCNLCDLRNQNSNKIDLFTPANHEKGIKTRENK
eukprot:Lithocolla_globosa_v1_NODE_2287_length_2065_cov_28.338308.p3 type:complete len:104 gc:universal NODE_2287_length_2065_cov_28.338308:1318-1007(-)